MAHIIENDEAKQAIVKFLDSESQYALLVVGPSGSGKTVLCQTLVTQASSYQCFRPTYEDYTSHKEFSEAVDKFVKMKNMLEIFEKKRKILFLDDIDVLCQQDRYANVYIQNIIENKQVKLLLTCRSGDEKRISDLRKKVLAVRMYHPSFSACAEYLKSHYDLSNISDLKIHEYIKSMQRSIRACDLNIEMLYSDINFQDEEIHRTNFDKNILDLVTNLIKKPLTCKQLDICISEDPTLISFIVYENALPLVKSCDTAIKLVEAYKDASNMETLMYSKNDLILNDICNLYRCGIAKSLIQPDKLKLPLNYTCILTRASNYYNAMKRIGEQEAQSSISYAAIQRAQELDPKAALNNTGVTRKHKEDSALSNYMKRIYKAMRICEKREIVRRKCD